MATTGAEPAGWGRDQELALALDELAGAVARTRELLEPRPVLLN